MTKELIVLCDGTGDSPELPNANWTNVVLIRSILGAGFAGKTKIHVNIREGWEIDVFQVQNTTRVIYYDRGVGAPILDQNGNMSQWSWSPMDFFKNAKYIYRKFKAYDEKINAHGIIDNVSQAYYFLSRNFEPGDQIYLFGFSRGAYTLRILLDLISYIGLIDRAKFSDEQSLKAAITMGL